VSPEYRHTDPLRGSTAQQRSRALTLRRRQMQRRAQLMMSGLLVALILLAAGGLWFLSIERRYQQRIYPNIFVLGVNVGGLQVDEAEQALYSHFRSFIDVPVILNFEGKSWRVSGEELGLQMHIEDSVQQAYTIGRTRDMIGNMQTIWQTLQQSVSVPVMVVVDEHKTQASVARLSRVIDVPARDPRVYIDGTTLVSQRGARGRMLLIDETVARIRETLPLLASQQITIATRELLPRVDDAAIAAAQARITILVGAPLTIQVSNKEYVWSSEELARMIEIVQRPASNGTGDEYQVFFNPYQIEYRIEKIAQETQTMPVYPRVAWNGGDLKITRQGSPGWRLNKHEGRDLIVNSVDQGQRTVVLKPRYVAVPINESNLNTLGINELVSEGKSDFTGSAPYRVTNIQAGLALLDGVLIAPGEEFSFNDTVGEIDESNGFVKGYAIIQQRTQLEFGGGICQDSTTVFRAAFWAGLPITERWGHSFYISWYDKYGPTGMDSTIFTGGPDLKFLNDTGHWLLMQTTSNAKTGIASVKLYGKSPQRRVELVQQIYDRVPAPVQPVYVTDVEQPAGTVKHSDRARDGLTIDIQRTIVEADGTVREPERYRTRFKPWPNIYVFNPADLANGTPLIALPPEQPNLNTPSLTPDGGVRYVSPEKTAPLAEAPLTPPTN
jgi:vancomycin resistance protein YoaR